MAQPLRRQGIPSPRSASMISAPSDSRRVLVFAIAGRTRCCELDQVREIVPISGTTRLPGAPLFVRGLINLRGNLVTVLDAAMSLYGVSGDDTSASILLVERGNGVAGVVVDNVFDIQSLPNVEVNGGALLDLHAMVESALT